MSSVVPAGAAALFSPYEVLASALLPHATGTDDGSHDVAHLARVWKNAALILAEEGGDAEIVAAAVLLHDCVSVEKNAPDRNLASRLAARQAVGILSDAGWEAHRVEAVAHAVEAHSFSAGIAPRTLEARIVQDADRLDAIGMVGAARCFYVAGRMGSALYDPLDPKAERRQLSDREFAIDHFEAKLFSLAAGFGTATGAGLAEARDRRLRDFLDAFLDEI